MLTKCQQVWEQGSDGAFYALMFKMSNASSFQIIKLLSYFNNGTIFLKSLYIILFLYPRSKELDSKELRDLIEEWPLRMIF